MLFTCFFYLFFVLNAFDDICCCGNARERRRMSRDLTKVVRCNMRKKAVHVKANDLELCGTIYVVLDYLKMFTAVISLERDDGSRQVVTRLEYFDLIITEKQFPKPKTADSQKFAI